MAGIEVVAVELDIFGKVTLADLVVSGNWREWLAKKDFDEPCDVDLNLLETSIPGVFMVGPSDAWLGSPNPGASRILQGRDDREPGFRGAALVFGYNSSFGGRMLRLGGSQRVAVEAAAYGDWTAFKRAIVGIKLN
jgi:hypothetical protein